MSYRNIWYSLLIKEMLPFFCNGYLGTNYSVLSFILWKIFGCCLYFPDFFCILFYFVIIYIFLVYVYVFHMNKLFSHYLFSKKNILSIFLNKECHFIHLWLPTNVCARKIMACVYLCKVFAYFVCFIIILLSKYVCTFYTCLNMILFVFEEERTGKIVKDSVKSVLDFSEYLLNRYVDRG